MKGVVYSNQYYCENFFFFSLTKILEFILRVFLDFEVNLVTVVDLVLLLCPWVCDEQSEIY